MKFNYESVTGTITIDVGEEWVAILEDMDRQDANNDKKERRRHFHLDACEYEGADFAAEDPAFERFLESDEAKQLITPALSKLTPKQQELIRALYFEELSAREFADRKGCARSSVSEAHAAALKKIKKFLKTT